MDRPIPANLIWAVDNRFLVLVEPPTAGVIQNAVENLGVGVVVTMAPNPPANEAFVSAFGESDETRMLRCRTQADLASVPTFSLFTSNAHDLDVFHFPLRKHHEPTVIQIDCFLELCEQTFARTRTVLLLWHDKPPPRSERKEESKSSGGPSLMTFTPGLLATCWIIQNTVRKREVEEDDDREVVCEQAVAYVCSRFHLTQEDLPMFFIDFWQLCECRKTVAKVKNLRAIKSSEDELENSFTRVFSSLKRRLSGDS